MYARLAKFIVKHYQLVIAVWIVVLFYTFPLIFKINEVVVYSETETGLDNLEAMEAQELIDANFAGEVAPSTIMIVMKSDQSNILGNHVRDFTGHGRRHRNRWGYARSPECQLHVGQHLPILCSNRVPDSPGVVLALRSGESVDRKSVV